MPSDWILLVIVAAVFAFAGAIKGVIGVGLPTIATGLLGVFMPPAQIASLVVVPALVTNVWQMWAGPGFVDLLKRLWPMLTCVVAGTIATAGIVTGGNVRLSVALLGAALMLYAAHALLGTRLIVNPKHERIVGALAGLVTGVISGATGVFVVPTVPFLQAIDLGKDELVQAIAITAFVSAAALAFGLGVHGGLGHDVALPATVGVAAALAGMGLGQILRSRLSLETFRRWVLIGLLGLGGMMVARGLL
jgi:uncharacterized protein